MIVTRSNFDSIIEDIRATKVRSLDTETYGLRPYHGDKLFSIIMATSPTQPYYFNFKEYVNLPEDKVLTPEHLAIIQDELLDEKTCLWYLHNAKFDMAILAQDKMKIEGEIFCCLAQGRVEYNEHLDYDLEASLERIGLKKSGAVDDYIMEHKLWDWVEIPGKKQRDKNKYFWKVPYDIIVPYGELDATGTFALGSFLKSSIEVKSQDLGPNVPHMLSVSQNESRLIKTVFRLEQVGVRADKKYCLQASRYETERATKNSQEFQKVTGVEYKQSPKLFAEIFIGERDKWSFTDKGNPSFDAEALEKFSHPAAKAILEMRDAKSKADFYNGFIYHSDANGDVHPNFNLHGANHGRFSSSRPNFQNLTSEESEAEVAQEFVVRRAIIPRPGFIFIMPDYDQMEYRLMLDIAADLLGHETPLISLVKSGLDVHEATAQISSAAGAKIGRFEAKHSNFCAVYGGGDQMLCDTINKLSKGKANCTRLQAKAIKQAIFKAAPEMLNLTNTATRVAETRGYVRNWFGRRCNFPNRRFSYRATNYLVAGGCADVVKIAMNQVDEYLLNFKSRMVLTVHDELPCEIHESELHLAPKIKEIMENVYPSKYLPLTTGMEWSDKSLGDKKKGMP